MEQKEKLGLNPVRRGHSKSQTPPPEPTNAFQKVEVCVAVPIFLNINITFFFLKKIFKQLVYEIKA